MMMLYSQILQQYILFKQNVYRSHAMMLVPLLSGRYNYCVTLLSTGKLYQTTATSVTEGKNKIVYYINR
jgi:hypothetical protein